MDEKMKAPTVLEDACIKGSNNMEYEDRLLVLKPSALSEDYRFGEFQYFFAKAGFGCYPDKLGTKVFGEFLIDGEKCQFYRHEFYGIADDEKLPDWAKQKMVELKNREKEEFRKSVQQLNQSLS